MENKPDIRKIFLLLLGSVIATSIPIYFINEALQKRQQIGMAVSQTVRKGTPILNPTGIVETPQGQTLLATPLVTAVSLATITSSTTPEPTPLSEYSNAYITEVLFIEDGLQNLVKIRFSEELEGQFFAKVENLWSEFAYSCFIFNESKLDLYCLGAKLRPASQAAIYVFKGELGSDEARIIFSNTFEVPYLILQPTKTKVPSAAPKYTPTPNWTPTHTPIPTNIPTIGPPPPPWETPPTPDISTTNSEPISTPSPKY